MTSQSYLAAFQKLQAAKDAAEAEAKTIRSFALRISAMQAIRDRFERDRAALDRAYGY